MSDPRTYMYNNVIYVYNIVIIIISLKTLNVSFDSPSRLALN